MRDYEVVYIFRSSLGTEDIESRVSGYHDRILATADAAITAVVHWGKRELAYPIDNDRNGYYVVAQFTAPAEALPPFERALKLDDDLLRHLVVISEGELPTLPPEEEEPARPRSGAEDGDDGESDKRDDSDDADEADDDDSDDADEADDDDSDDADDADEEDADEAASDDADDADDVEEED